MYVSIEKFLRNFKRHINNIIKRYEKLKLRETNRPIYDNKSNYWLLLFLINYLGKKYPDIKIQIIMTDEPFFLFN